MADTDEAPSFLQAALAETVHREHTEHIDNRGNKHTHARFHQRRAHVHDAHVHERQDDAQPTPNPTVTAVVQTVSVVRQVAVDGAGNTISDSASTYTANTANTAVTDNNEGTGATAAPAAPAPTGNGEGASAAPTVPDPVPSDTASVTSLPQPTEPQSTDKPTDIPTDVPSDIPSSTVEPVLPPPTTSFPETTAAPLPSDVPSFSSLTPVNGTGRKPNILH